MVKSNKKVYMVILLTTLLLINIIVPVALSKNTNNIKGFDKGPSYTYVVPFKKATFVNYDENTYLDDYAYLASIPTTVFRDNDKLYSNPLLFYQDEYPIKEDKELSLNARQGLDYFMEDWMGYCNGEMDQMTLLNVPEEKVKQWKAKEYNTINSEDPYELASQIALSEWSYSDEAVLAVIDEEFERSDKETTGMIKGEIVLDKPVKEHHFEVKQTNRLNPVFSEFTVPEGYMYVYARCWYASLAMSVKLPIPGIEMFADISIPSGDKDLQLYCKHGEDWMQILTMDRWNQKMGMDKEKGGTYVYNTGQWRASVTDIPTKKMVEITDKYGTWMEILKNLKQVIYQVDISMYPGERISIFDNDMLPFECRDAKIELNCKNPDINLGFCLIGPSGEEIASSEEGIIEVNQLTKCLPGESYDVAIYTEEDIQGSFDYEISYSWQEGKTKYESDCLADATEGSVLASMLNAPLLYTSLSELSKEAIDALYMLGVEDIYLVDLGNHLSKSVKEELKEIANLKEEYKSYSDIYDAIREQSGSNDIVFSTTDAWRPWFIREMKPAEDLEMLGALHIGPAAYLAAHHGTPVIIVDNHPETSTAVLWHNELWEKGASSPAAGKNYPAIAEMYLTGKRVYNFLEELGFDKEGLETIITVAGQFDIGMPWDRVFVGKANPGRFIGTPVDTSYWIPRNIFYPALIFENPATNPEGVEMIQGSESYRGGLLGLFKKPYGNSLVIDKPSQKETVEYPVLSSFLHYEHRFNERASNYWGFTYQCADGMIPGSTETFNPIDQGLAAKFTGNEGCIFPDMSMSEVLPMYLEKGGYGNSFSTSFPAVVNNINNGVLLWCHFAHGLHPDGGTIQFWDDSNKKDQNPWRMYEVYLGSTEEPDTLTIEIHGILPALLGNPNMNGIFRTALDWAPARMPIRDKISNFLSYIPIVNKIVPEGFLDTQDYYDGMIDTLLISMIGAVTKNGTDFDNALENMHSAGFIANSCLIATKYMHLTMMRHGSAFQIVDPWPTSWYGAVWTQSIPRDIILGDTVGEAYTKGLSHVGVLHITDPPQWWWDNAENVIYFGDPDLRFFVPSTEFSDANYWEKEETLPIRYDSELAIKGHMPFGATEYPNEKQPKTLLQEYLPVILAIIAILILLILMVYISRNKK